MMCKTNVDKYMRLMFDYKCKPYQLDFATSCMNNKRIVAVFCRQSGKTETTSKIAIMLARKRKKGDVLIFAPTERQTELMAQKIATNISKMEAVGHYLISIVQIKHYQHLNFLTVEVLFVLLLRYYPRVNL